MIDYFFNAARSIFRKKGRNLLTIIGIAVGVLSVIVVENISNIGISAVSKELDSLGLNGLTISSKDSVTNLTTEELEIIRSSECTAKATPIVVDTGEAETKKASAKVIMWGIDHSAGDIISLELMYGRFINLGDIKNYSKVCLVDKEFAQTMYSRDNIVGKKISLISQSGYEEFTVIGIIKTGSGLLQNAMGNYIPNFVYVPYSTLQTSIGMSGFHQVAVKISNSYNVDTAGKYITDKLSKATGKNDGYISQNLAKQKEALFDIMDIISLILTAIGSVSLVVAGLNIMTVMLVSVNERTKEIGIKKAIGATNKAILCEFLFEAVLLCLIGAIIGIIFAALVLLGGSKMLGISMNFRYDIVIYAAVFSALAGIVFGVYPANKAAHLNPVNSLRAE